MRSARRASTAPRPRSFSASPSGSSVTACSAWASRMILGPDGLMGGCRYVESPTHDERPPGEEATLLVVHSISLPPGEYGGDAIERFFTNRLDPAAHPYF